MIMVPESSSSETGCFLLWALISAEILKLSRAACRIIDRNGGAYRNTHAAPQGIGQKLFGDCVLELITVVRHQNLFRPAARSNCIPPGSFARRVSSIGLPASLSARHFATPS